MIWPRQRRWKALWVFLLALTLYLILANVPVGFLKQATPLLDALDGTDKQARDTSQHWMDAQFAQHTNKQPRGFPDNHPDNVPDNHPGNGPGNGPGKNPGNHLGDHPDNHLDNDLGKALGDHPANALDDHRLLPSPPPPHALLPRSVLPSDGDRQDWDSSRRQLLPNAPHTPSVPEKPSHDKKEDISLAQASSRSLQNEHDSTLEKPSELKAAGLSPAANNSNSHPRGDGSISPDPSSGAWGGGRGGQGSLRSPSQLFGSHNVSAESPELMAELYQRARRVDEVCAARGRTQQEQRGVVTGVFMDEPSRVAYCFLPKAGCTFWIRIFSFLHNYTGVAVDSPWQIPRLQVHNNPHSHGAPWSKVKAAVLRDDYLRFMFVRHPFSRLWSAYVDKLILPDFWSEVGVPAVQTIRGSSGGDGGRGSGKGNDAASAHARRCGNDVTFREFVEYSLTTSEPHWDPIYRRCDPCQYRPALVGRMATFSRDSLFMLKRLGLDWVLKGLNHAEQEEKELTTLIDYNFARVRELPFYKGCVNDTHLARLLWRAFQLNGYIPKEAPFSSRQHNDHAGNGSSPVPAQTSLQRAASGQGNIIFLEAFKDRVVKTFRSWKSQGSGGGNTKKRQKKEFMQEAINSLPAGLRERLKTKYQPDMQYFGFTDDNY